jgi:hypothetical protein
MTRPGATEVWPTPHAAWHDPPWLLSGRSVTAWYSVPWEIVEKAVCRELLPPPAPTVRARLRFYDLNFMALSGVSGGASAPASGHFREATIGFTARGSNIDGDVSQFMWTDSDTYMAWGREAFGWPLRRGAFELRGSLWDQTDLVDAAGSCRLLDPAGVLTLIIHQVGEKLVAEPPHTVWFVPRRLLQLAGIDGEKREILVVRPIFRRPPARYRASGRAAIDFDGPHVLNGIYIDSPEFEITDGIELEVGSQVERIDLGG